jgi:MFS family permease
MVLMRIGWIFKTESIIMPAVLDVIGGQGWLRGCLPMLNRFGQSIPPLLASDRVRNSEYKKYGLFSTTSTMGLCFLVLSFVWFLTDGQKSAWLPFVFLLIYGLFFASTGINQLTLNTITGKLIRVKRRGALSLWGTVFGAGIAVVCAWFLLRLWLVDGGDESNASFGLIFAFTGTMFLGAATLALFLKERPDEKIAGSRTARQLFSASWETVKEDRNFRKLAIIGGLFGMYLTLFPHYQRLGRDRLELTMVALIPWVIAQNLGAAFFSIPSGWLADRFGNRLVLRLAMPILCIPPVLALIVAQMPGAGNVWFTIVFCMLGLTPVAMRYLNNYTLEVCESLDRPRYLSTLSLALAAPPIFLSPLFGAMIDWISFEFVFSIVILCMLGAWLMTFVIDEPRDV